MHVLDGVAHFGAARLSGDSSARFSQAVSMICWSCWVMCGSDRSDGRLVRDCDRTATMRLRGFEAFVDVGDQRHAHAAARRD